MKHCIRLALAAAVLGLCAGPEGLGQGAKKSDAVVKVSATADKPGGDGKQVITVTLNIEEGWHTYANPVGNQDLAEAQTVVAVGGKARPESVQVDYPEGKTVPDKVLGDYKVYEGKVTIKATVKRARGDTEPLELTVKFQSCNDKSCLLPASVKVTPEVKEGR